MAIAIIPINNIPSQFLDNSELINSGSELIDCYAQLRGETFLRTKKRPGLSLFKDIGSSQPIDGLFYFLEVNRLIAVSNGTVYSIKEDGTTTALTSTGELIPGVRPAFSVIRSATTTDQNVYLMIAAGKKIVYTDGFFNPKVMADGDAPTEVTHLGMINNRQLAFYVKSDKASYTTIDENGIQPLAWDGLDFFSAEYRSDFIVSYLAYHAQALLFGNKTLEIWYDAGNGTFNRRQDLIFEIGCIAPYSTTICDDVVYWLDDRRRAVRLVGGRIEVLPGNFDVLIQNYDVVEDVIADYLYIDGKRFYLLSFPTEQKTWVFDIDLGYWSEWTEFKTLANRERFLGSNTTVATLWNKTLLGSVNDDKIYEMDIDNNDDNGVNISMVKISGNIDHGTRYTKRSKAINIVVRRGEEETDEDDPKLLIRWQDNNTKQWSDYREYSLGNKGDSESIITIRGGLGMYRSRQYELRFTGDIPFSIVDMEEEFDILRR